MNKIDQENNLVQYMNLSNLKNPNYIDPLYLNNQKFVLKNTGKCPVLNMPRREVFPKNNQFFSDEKNKNNNYALSFRRLSKYSPCPSGFESGADDNRETINMCYAVKKPVSSFYTNNDNINYYSKNITPVTYKNNGFTNGNIPLRSNAKQSKYVTFTSNHQIITS